MLTRSLRRAVARLSVRRRLLRELRRRADWVDQARNTPTLERWLETRAELASKSLKQVFDAHVQKPSRPR